MIIGGDGNGGVAAACIKDMQINFNIHDYEVAGFINDFIKPGEKINDYPVLGDLTDTPRYIEEGYYFIYAIHSVAHAPLRIKIFE